MFEWGWIEDLDAGQAADELARSYELLVAAEAGQFLLAAHWADLHAPEFVEETRATLPGMPGAMRIAGEGCPEIDEFAGAELGVLLRRSSAGGERMVRQALLVRHRHPLLWTGIREGKVRVWMAAKVAERCATVGLGQEQTAWVDARTTPFIESLPTTRFFALVEATIIEVDPAGAEERDRARALCRSVTTGRTDEYGLRTLVARADAGEIAYVAAVIDRIAVILADQGDPDPVEARRATALRILANPARALALLMEASVEALDPALETPVLGTEERARCLEGEYREAGGAWVLPARRPVQEPPDGGLDVLLDESVVARDHGQDLLPPWGELRALLQQLRGIDTSALDPVHVLHVHLSDAALAARSGVVRVEDVGPRTLAAVRDWLAHPTAPEHVTSRISLRPVLDAEAVVPVDRYEVPKAMAELLATRQPYEVYPWGTLTGRKGDKDHVRPYRRGGAKGQTDPDKMALLGRKHHRIKTFAPGWMLVQPEPGVFWWRARQGHWARVDHTGTHYHGRDPALDSRWCHGVASDPPA